MVIDEICGNAVGNVADVRKIVQIYLTTENRRAGRPKVCRKSSG